MLENELTLAGAEGNNETNTARIDDRILMAKMNM